MKMATLNEQLLPANRGPVLRLSPVSSPQPDGELLLLGSCSLVDNEDEDDDDAEGHLLYPVGLVMKDRCE